MTKEKIIAELKIQYPTLKSGSEESGYTQLSSKDYEATIEQWANSQIAEEAKIEEQKLAKVSAEAKLAALGLTADDLKALGL
jgi:hypothetical protein